MQKSLVLLCLFCAVNAHAADRNKTVRRLRVGNYPELPPSVVAALQDRRCTIPQPNQHGPKRNVIQGEFFRRGQRGWAVLCSSGGKSSILVFRDSYDRSPQQIAESKDKRFIIDGSQGGKIYSREISAVGQEFVLSHHLVYGGAKPPPIDQDCIDDAFLEKASITWCWHDGDWVQLQGAD